MRRLIALSFVLGALAHCAAWAGTPGLIVTRQSANHYYDHTHDRVLITRDCTVTARLMDARVEGFRGRWFLVFLDAQGEEEGECQLR